MNAHPSSIDSLHRNNPGHPDWARPLRLIVLLWILSCAIKAAQASSGLPPYKSAGLAVELRVADLLGRMSLAEKARQLDMYSGCESLLDPDQCADKTHAKPGAVFNPQTALIHCGTLGVGSIHDLYPRAALANQIQAWVMHASRLGIPALFIEEGLHGYMDYGETHRC